MMHKFYKTLFFVCLSALATAQTVVVPPNLTNDNGFIYTDISAFVTGDTAANGSQLNDVYLLEAGGVYLFSQQVEWDFPVTLRATGDVENLGRPFIDRINLTGGTALDPIYRGFGSFTWDGLYIVMGEEGPTAATYELAPFRPSGDNGRYVFNNCIIEKSRQGAMRIDGEGGVAIMTNNYIRNFGDYQRLQGNGRLVDPRTGFIDSVVIRNNYVHNILDRMYIGFRSPGGGYFDFSNNTVFNHLGRHGFLQLGTMQESHINDNLFLNTQIFGTRPEFADEQITYFNDKIYMFSVDSLPANATAEMKNNAIHWTSEVRNLWATFDSIQPALTISPELATLIGDTTNSLLYGPITLNNVPSVDPLIQYTREAITFPDSSGITDIMVEDIAYVAAIPAYDNGNNFDFTAFDPCLPTGSPLLNASTQGGAVGATWLCSYTSSGVRDVNFNRELELKVTPNPANEVASFSFTMPTGSRAELNVYDAQGKLVANIHNGFLAEGSHNFSYDQVGNLATGMYFVNLRTEANGRMFQRLVVQH